MYLINGHIIILLEFAPFTVISLHLILTILQSYHQVENYKIQIGGRRRRSIVRCAHSKNKTKQYYF